MFDEIGADLRKDGHRIVRHADRDAFAKLSDPLERHRYPALRCRTFLWRSRCCSDARKLRAIVLGW